RMLGDKAYDSAELRDDLHERGTKPVTLQQEATFQFQQAYLQAALAHRERVQQAEGLQAHCNPLRQAGAKLPGLCLPRRCSCMVDLMSLDPSSQADLDRRSHDPWEDIEAWQPLSARLIRPGGVGCAHQAKELGAPR